MLWLRPAEDREQFKAWAEANKPRNQFDAGILDYPLTKIIEAYGEDGTKCYLPFQPVLMLESLAPKPGIDERELITAVRLLLQATSLVAQGDGIREIIFLGSDEATNAAAELVGFEKVELAVYRKRL